jgi:hypothetical protein
MLQNDLPDGGSFLMFLGDEGECCGHKPWKGELKKGWHFEYGLGAYRDAGFVFSTLTSDTKIISFNGAVLH